MVAATRRRSTGSVAQRVTPKLRRSSDDPVYSCPYSGLMGSDDPQMGVNVVQSEDLEEFTLKLGEAIAHWSLDGPPTVAFSHAPKEGGGFDYAAVVVGYGLPGTTVSTRLTDED
jgi:hypothetical protein